jgi:hypothetical protein
MEGAKRLRHKVPSVVRSFLPNRLAEEFEATAYERLLVRSLRGDLAGSDFDETANDPKFEEETEELVATGGRS